MRVLVTGGSRGIGRSIVETLSPECDLVVGYQSSDRAATEIVSSIEDEGGTATAIEGDVADPEQADHLVEQTVTELGGLDAVVNNAGIVDPARTPDLAPPQWQRVLDVNLSGAFYVTKAAIEYLVPNGDIVFISSIGGTGGTVDPSYAASKAGLHGLTRALAREYGEDGVQVNAVAPGPVTTDLNDEILEFLESTEFRGHEGIDTHLPSYACEPNDVSHAVQFILENEYLQGEIIALNGGMQFR